MLIISFPSLNQRDFRLSTSCFLLSGMSHSHSSIVKALCNSVSIKHIKRSSGSTVTSSLLGSSLPRSWSDLHDRVSDWIILVPGTWINLMWVLAIIYRNWSWSFLTCQTMHIKILKFGWNWNFRFKIFVLEGLIKNH